MKTKILTPAQQKNELRKRLTNVLKRLPEKWVNVFKHIHPEYADKGAHLNNVQRGQSLDEAVISKMEILADTLKPQTVKLKKAKHG